MTDSMFIESYVVANVCLHILLCEDRSNLPRERERYMKHLALLLWISVLALVLLAGCRPVRDTRFPEATVRALDAAIAAHMEKYQLPSVAVGIWVPGQGEYVTAVGEADLAAGTLRTGEQPFRIASITKTFIATLILRLVDQGLLQTSDTIDRWFSDFPNADQITVDHLLRMRSGIADPQDGEFLVRYYSDPTMAFTAAGLIADAASRADQFVPPDQKTVYTNINYVMLEEIARMVTGKEIDVLIDEQIAQPLGLSDTYYPTTNDLPGGLHGYSWNAGTAAYEDLTVLNPAGAGGAGAVISSLADLRIYARALCTGALLKPDTQQTRLATTALDGEPEWVRYGQGVETLAGFCGHNGTIFGFSSEMYYLPEEDAVIVINVNRLDADDRSYSSDLFATLAKLLFPENVAW
jgi:D-alanyl-D-alanine carboxypeptidase